MEELFKLAMEYVKIQFLLEPIMVFNVLKHLRHKQADIQNLFECLGAIDLCVSVASLRHGVQLYCLPVVTEERGTLKFSNRPLRTSASFR